MWDQSQIRYMEEVLGIADAAGWLPSMPSTRAPLLILTARLEPDESALLNKILSSVRLPKFSHHEVEIFNGHEADHLVVFDGGSGTRVENGTKSWHLPELKDMLGSSVQVTALKRTTWTLLQQLSQELA